MKKLFCFPALELFRCLPLWKTVLFVSSRAFLLSTPTFLLSTLYKNSEATWKKATKCNKQLVRAWSVGCTGRLLNTYPLLPTYVWFKTTWTTNILYKLWWLEQIIWNKYSPVWINFYWILLIKDYLLRTVLFQLYYRFCQWSISCEIFAKKSRELAILKNNNFEKSAILNFFLKKKGFFCFILMKISLN